RPGTLAGHAARQTGTHRGPRTRAGCAPGGKVPAAAGWTRPLPSPIVPAPSDLAPPAPPAVAAATGPSRPRPALDPASPPRRPSGRGRGSTSGPGRRPRYGGPPAAGRGIAPPPPPGPSPARPARTPETPPGTRGGP